MSELSTIISTLQELERLHQLNFEMLEQLDVIFKWIIESNMPIPNSEKLVSLFSKSQALLNELCANSPKTLQYTTSRRKVTPFKTDEDVPVPIAALYKGAIVFPSNRVLPPKVRRCQMPLFCFAKCICVGHMYKMDLGCRTLILDALSVVYV